MQCAQSLRIPAAFYLLPTAEALPSVWAWRVWGWS
jgi:hypothetical protein